MQELTVQQAQSRTAAVTEQIRSIQTLLRAMPREVQADIGRETEALFQARIVPLREQWNQALAQKRQGDQVRFQELSKELQADADAAGKLQAQRTILRERVQQGAVPQADAARADQQAEQQVLALTRKYQALDDERAQQGARPYWVITFQRAIAGYTNREVAALRLRGRLDDTETDIGRDAHRAADLTLTIQRNQYFVSQQALSPQAAQSANTTAQTLLTTLQQKHAASPANGDYKDRVNRLVAEGAAAQRPQWVRDAADARQNLQQQEAERRRAQAQPQPMEPARTALPATGGARTVENTPAPAPGRGNAPRQRTRTQTQARDQAVATAIVIPPSDFLPASAVPGGGVPWSMVIVVLLVGGAGAGAYVMRTRKVAAPPRFADAPTVAPPAPHEPDYDFVDAVPTDAGQSLKERTFAAQRAKYQARYNDAQDEATHAAMALSQQQPLLAAAHANLHVLGDSLYDRVRASLVARHGGAGRALANAALFRPLWRLFRRSGLLLKLAIGFGVLWSFNTVTGTIATGGLATVVVVYALYVAVAFFIERHLILKSPLAALKKNANEFKNLRMSYIFADQRPEVRDGRNAVRGIRITTLDQTAVAHEEWYDPSAGIPGYTLAVGALAGYQLQPSGSVTRTAGASGNPFVSEHGQLLDEVLSNLGDFAATTLPPLAQYGQAHWTRLKAASQLPQLEALVRDVDRIEKVWDDTYVADDVFEVIFRSIDMFNMRDAATPPGLLIHGGAGNGKKHLAKKIAETLSARFEQVNPAKLGSADQIEALWAASRGTDPVLLFIPNAEAVFPRQSDGTSAHNTLEFIAEWEKHEPRDSRVWVVMTTGSADKVDEAVINHIGQDSRVEIKAPDAAGRKALIDTACRQYQVGTRPPDSVVRTTGPSIQDLGRFVMAAKRAAAPRQPQDEHWLQAYRTVLGPTNVDDTKTWDRLILPNEIKQQLQAACKILQDAPEFLKKGAKVPNILLYGPPGTGKTEIARTIANEAGVNFEVKNVSDLKGKYLGESGQNVKEMFAKARAKAPTVLFMDEIDGAAKARGSEGADKYTEEIVGELLAQMDGATKSDRPVFVLAATNLVESIDRAILERFTRRIKIPLPDEDARRQIFRGALHGKPLEPGLDPDALAETVARRTDGFSGRSLVRLIENALNQALAEAPSADQFHLTSALILKLVDELRATDSDTVDPNARWNTLVVAPDTLVQLRQLSDAVKHMEIFLRQGIEPPRGAVLFGPPGTGKTRIATTLANESGVRFVSRTGADLGRTAQDVRKVFDAARAKAPCILFFDEFEKAAQSREKGGDSEVVTELLAQMQGAKKSDRPIFVLAATNYLDQMDDAILSRFTYRIEVPNPQVEEREKLFAIALSSLPRAEFDVPVLSAELARSGGGLSGRNINDVVVRASQAAGQRALAAGTPDKVTVTREDLVREVERLIREGVGPVDPTARWDTLVLSDATIKTLKQISTAVRNIEDRLKQGIEPPRGAVLFGPPGTGKTQIARTLANESGVQFMSATSADITGQYVGESTQKVKKLFADARKKAPCILFIDEFENAAASRTGTKGSGFAEEVVTQLLAEMDGVKATGRPVFVLAATNHLERVDSAVLSRFTYQVEVPNPSPEQRERLFEIALRKYPRTDFDRAAMAAELAARSGGMGGRQIGDLVKKAVQDAAQRAEEAGAPNDIILTQADLLAQLAPKGRPVSDSELEKVWTGIVLAPETKDTLLSMIRLFNSGSKAAPKGLLLYGPPGTGKTEIARMLARSTGCEFLATDLTKLKGAHVGESGQRVRELWEKARTHGRAIIFVDECDGVFARRGGTNTDAFVEDITNAFLPMWDGLESSGQIWVVGATNKRERIDEAIESRFGEKIEIGLPGAPERLAILRMELQKLESSIEVPDFVGRATSGLAGRNLSKIASAVFRLAHQNGGQATDDIWRRVVAQFASGGDPVDSDASWNTLVLQEPVMKRLRRISEMLKHAEVMREQGLEPPRATLLFGPPGTGKTQIARTIANESGLNFIAAGPTDLKGAHLGESGKMVRELFERARSKPTVLFIDEIESSAAARTGGRGDQYTNEIVNELLTQMDGVKKTTGTVFVLAATNHPDQIDAAVRSRFEDKLEIPNPGEEERRRMVATFLAKRRLDFDADLVAAEVAARTEGLSGRDLMSLVRRASQASMDRALDAGTPASVVMTREDLLGQLAAGT